MSRRSNAIAAACLVIAGLVLLAWKLPRPFPWEKLLGPAQQEPDSLRWFICFGLAWTSLLFFFSWIFVALSPSATLTGIAMLAFFAVSGILLARKTGYGRSWTALHRHGLVAGSLGFFVLFGFILELGGVRGMSAAAVAFVLFLWWLRRRLIASEKTIPGGTEERPGVHEFRRDARGFSPGRNGWR